MAERKAFNIIKAVPGVGQAYGVVRGAVYAIKGDKAEAMHSVTLDVADLNPLRMPRNLVNGISSATIDLNQGIWIGKRPIGNQPFGLNIGPGVDGYHYCVQINGVIYQLGVDKDDDIKIRISSKGEKASYYESDCKTYSWFLMQKQVPFFDSDEFRIYAKSFEGREYQTVFALGGKMNCQSFATRMFATAANISLEKARSKVALTIPNILF